jgi:AcrR family transcriptional regulator
MDKQLIRNAYKVYWLENGKAPVSVYALCKIVDITEATFYEQYSSLEAVEKDIWLAIFQQTLEQLNTDDIYQQYNAQEKLLAFYFLWVQKLKEDRSTLNLTQKPFVLPYFNLNKL